MKFVYRQLTSLFQRWQLTITLREFKVFELLTSHVFFWLTKIPILNIFSNNLLYITHNFLFETLKKNLHCISLFIWNKFAFKIVKFYDVTEVSIFSRPVHWSHKKDSPQPWACPGLGHCNFGLSSFSSWTNKKEINLFLKKNKIENICFKKLFFIFSSYILWNTSNCCLLITTECLSISNGDRKLGRKLKSKWKFSF